jgi:hypothetical protein
MGEVAQVWIFASHICIAMMTNDMLQIPAMNLHVKGSDVTTHRVDPWYRGHGKVASIMHEI